MVECNWRIINFSFIARYDTANNFIDGIIKNSCISDVMSHVFL